MSKKKVKKNPQGFSLVELLVVITLLGLLSTLGAIMVTRQISKGRDAKIKSDIAELRKSLFVYYEDTGCFPSALPACGTSLTANGVTYMAKVPCHINNSGYIYEGDGNVCSSYFRIYSNLKNTSDKDIDLVGCRGGCGPSCGYNYGSTSTNTRITGVCSGATPVPPGGGPTATPFPTPTPSGTPSTPTPTGPMFACGPPNVGRCIEYADPGISGCPKVYYNDPTCQNECTITANQCQNERGKK